MHVRKEYYMQKVDYLKGIYNIMPTAFMPDGSLDEAGLAQVTEFVINTGVDGITILGVLGEADKLTELERDRVIAKTMEVVDGRVKVCVGTSGPATAVCVHFTKRAEELGADAVMVAPPKLSGDAALRRHYLTVAESTGLPIVIQDHPTSSGVNMSVDFIAKIAEETVQCSYLKLEDEPSPTKVTRVLQANPDVQIFGGLGGMMFLEELRHGAIGTMTGFGFPEILVDIYKRWSSGDRDGATEVFYRYCPLIRFENQKGINLAIRKHIYHLRGGLPHPTMREPYPRLDDDTIADMHDLFRRLELLPAPVVA
jgi:4-hydroxy-tetrahydrodipicolinate synthase